MKAVCSLKKQGEKPVIAYQDIIALTNTGLTRAVPSCSTNFL